MEYGLSEDESKDIEKQLKGLRQEAMPSQEGNKMDENDHWREQSRQKVEKTIRQGNYKHREYRGGLSRENMDVLEKAKSIFLKERKDLNGSSGRSNT